MAEQEIFDTAQTAFETMIYLITIMPPDVPFFGTHIAYYHPDGCNLRDKGRGSSLIELLNGLAEDAQLYSGFNVFIGPDIESDCAFVGDWISQSNASLAPIDRIFQVEYKCKYGYRSGYVSVNSPIDYLPSMTVVMHMMTIITRLELWLRTQGWRRLVVVCEISSTNTDCNTVATTIRFALNTRYPEMEKIVLIASVTYQPGVSAVHLLHLCGDGGVDGECQSLFPVVNARFGDDNGFIPAA